MENIVICSIKEDPSLLDEELDNKEISNTYYIGHKAISLNTYVDTKSFILNHTALDKKINIVLVSLENLDELEAIYSSKVIEKKSTIYIKIDKRNLKKFFKFYKEFIKAQLIKYGNVKFINVILKDNYFLAQYEVEI